LGTNYSIKEDLEIGNYSMILTGCVLNNVSENLVVVGNPAKIIMINKK